MSPLKSIRRIFLVAALLLAPALASAPTFADDGLKLFDTEQTAQKHCPDDTVVWLNLPTGGYHFRGQRWYGAMKNGSYVCRKEADMAGDRPTPNGQ